MNSLSMYVNKYANEYEYSVYTSLSLQAIRSYKHTGANVVLSCK